MNKIKGLSTTSKKAGRKWAKFFLRRYPQIQVKKAKNLSINRAMAANPATIAKWFKEYEKVLKDLGLNSPEQIWCGDEAGVQNVPKEVYVLGEKGKQVWQTVCGEQGETSTLLVFVNGIGMVVPPMILHRGQRVQEAWTRNAPVGVRVAATSKGYITKAKFHEYGIRFVRYLKNHNLLQKPHLLIVDSHKSHVYNIPFFKEMKANNIAVLAIPPHCSHLVQALDNVPFANFKRFWQQDLADFNFENKGRPLTKADFFSVFWPAFKDAMSVAGIQAGFRHTGIYPVNFDAVDKDKMGPSSVTDMPMSKTIIPIVVCFFRLGLIALH